MGFLSKIKDVLRLLRVVQWVKNGFVFLPLFFNKQILQFDSLHTCALAFFSFCLISSSIYCLNDLVDCEADRRHPRKKNRPIASGRIPSWFGYFFFFFLFVSANIILIFMIPLKTRLLSIVVLDTYFISNIAYCLFLKNIAIVDVMLISFGFVLRVIFGGVVMSIEVSSWIILMTFLLCLFLAFAKRRDDVLLYEKTGEKPRRNTDGYNLNFINMALSISATIAIVCYIMYTLSDVVILRLHSPYLFFTSFFH